MLTIQDLKNMKEGEIFDSGVIIDNFDGINMTNSDDMLKWVAKCEGIHAWCIYCHWDYRSIDFIASHGDKIQNKNYIRKLVECDDEAFKMYRY